MDFDLALDRVDPHDEARETTAWTPRSGTVYSVRRSRRRALLRRDPLRGRFRDGAAGATSLVQAATAITTSPRARRRDGPSAPPRHATDDAVACAASDNRGEDVIAGLDRGRGGSSANRRTRERARRTPAERRHLPTCTCRNVATMSRDLEIARFIEGLSSTRLGRHVVRGRRCGFGPAPGVAAAPAPVPHHGTCRGGDACPGAVVGPGTRLCPSGTSS